MPIPLGHVYALLALLTLVLYSIGNDYILLTGRG